MTPFRMAALHLHRQRGQTLIIIVSLTLALWCASLLVNLATQSGQRYEKLPHGVDAIVGAKSGGVEILLGALEGPAPAPEDLTSHLNSLRAMDQQALLPANLFETLKRGADIHFEDGVVVSSQSFTKVTTPLMYFGFAGPFSVLATDETIKEFLTTSSDEKFPTLQLETEESGLTTQAWVGWQAAERLGLKNQETFKVKLADQSLITFKVGKIIPRQNNNWDQKILVPLEAAQKWRSSAGWLHPVWKDKVLNFILIKWQLQPKPESIQGLQSLINDRTVSQLIFVDSEIEKLKSWTGTAQGVGASIVILILALAGVAIAGIWLIRADHLRVSVATLRAIGYSQSFLRNWLFSEALILGAISGLWALALNFVSIQFILRELPNPWFQFDSNPQFFILIEGMALSLLASALPFWRVTRVSIHDELKSG